MGIMENKMETTIIIMEYIRIILGYMVMAGALDRLGI